MRNNIGNHKPLTEQCDVVTAAYSAANVVAAVVVAFQLRLHQELQLPGSSRVHMLHSHLIQHRAEGEIRDVNPENGVRYNGAACAT